MEECEYCGEEFKDKTGLHLHWDAEHEEELNSHQKEKVKKAEREKDKRKQQKKAQYRQYSYYAISIFALVGLVAGAYFFMPEGAVFSGGNDNLGPAGSAHTHADFSVVINGEEVDFEKRKYMVVSNKVHIEAMNGDVVHGHATGATFKFFMNSLGFDYNATYLKTPETTYYEEEGGKQVKMYVETGGDWREIEPKAFEFNTGDRILLTYGDYTEEEINNFQSSVTEQSASMS